MTHQNQRQAPHGRLAKIIAAVTCLLFSGLGAFAIVIKVRSAEAGHDLAIKWEGAVNNRNFRDFGKSFNDCYGAPAMTEDRLFRAAVWFSGWSCDSVGRPDVIYSLNFDPRRDTEYFCHAEDGVNNIGRHFTTHKELNDLEFEASWDDPGLTEDACAYFRDSFAAIARGDRILIHCDAGRDRTGTYAAIVEAMVMEHRHALDQRALAAIECDYRKTRSLVPTKHGRMAAFISGLMNKGGVAHFLAERCQMTDAELTRTAEAAAAR